MTGAPDAALAGANAVKPTPNMPDDSRPLSALDPMSQGYINAAGGPESGGATPGSSAAFFSTVGSGVKNLFNGVVGAVTPHYLPQNAPGMPPPAQPAAAPPASLGTGTVIPTKTPTLASPTQGVGASVIGAMGQAGF